MIINIEEIILSLLNEEYRMSMSLHNEYVEMPFGNMEHPDEEVQDTIGRLYNNKVSGFDGLLKEIFKHGGDVLMKFLYVLILEVCFSYIYQQSIYL